MLRKFFLEFFSIMAVATLSIIGLSASRNSVTIASAQNGETQGSLQVIDSSGKPKAVCPLKHTDVKVEISGFLASAVITQEFENPFKEKIEAVYTFPLPQHAAVDDMTMLVGDRTVRGKILRREEAQAVYEAAKSNGQTASLLNQERPNIFTQSVANILPGEQIKITISYVETLKYEDGSYEFVFPMVVGPRYVPAEPVGAKGNGFAPNMNRVPDASRITPPPPEGLRAGHDISLDIVLDAGVSIDGLASKTHDLDIERADDRRAHLHLKELATIPNKDFILRYDVAGQKMQDALMTHAGNNVGYFTLILQPPEKVTAADVMPKELVFVLDTSGSMSGFPIEKAKETMKLALDNLYPTDTFNLITFSGDEHILFPEPVPASRENLRKAQEFLESRQGGGGTEMMKAIKASMDPSDAQDHVRIVCFITDVYPKTIPDLFSVKPVILTGRYTGSGKGSIRLKGRMSGRDFVREIPVDFSDSQKQHDVLATLWARNRVDDLMSQDFNGAQQSKMRDDVKQAIVQLGLDYRLMTQFTSFVAV